MSRSLLALGASALSLLSVVDASYIQYSTVSGFFLQDVSTTVASTFSYSTTNFGLINQTYSTDAAFDPSGTKTQWQRFENYVNVLNSQTNSSTHYKVLYMGRHGEGYHNAAQTYYGDAAWNCYWGELEGNGTIVWADAHITSNGVAQAQVANTFWTSQIANQKQTLPQSYYTSPLSRCLETANITFYGLTEQVPTVKELFREGISMHTCDRRSNKTYIHDSFPTYKIEAGFTEDDELWRGIAAETSAAQDVRSMTVLDEVFSSDSNTFLSITSHSGEIGSLLRVLGHQTFSLATGAVIPVLVEARVISGSATTSSISSWSTAATCTQPPLSTLTDGECVCPSGTSSSTTLSTSPASINASLTSTSSLPTGTGIGGSSSISSSVIYSNSTTEASTATSTGSSLTLSASTGQSTANPASTSCPVALITKVVSTTELSTVTLCEQCSASALCPAESTKTYTTVVAVNTTICPLSTSTFGANATSVLPIAPISVSTSSEITLTKTVGPGSAPVISTTFIQTSSTTSSSVATLSTAPSVSNSAVVSISSDSLASESSDAATKMTTSTVTATDVITISKCAPTITDCPYTTSPVVSLTIYTYTTVCPAAETESLSSIVTTNGASSMASPKMTTSIILTTEIITISKCAPTVTNCPFTTSPVVLSTVYSYTTVCPVTENKTVLSSTFTKEASSAATSVYSKALSGSKPTTGATSASGSIVVGFSSKPTTSAITSVTPGSGTPPYATGNSTSAVYASGSGVNTGSSVISTSTTHVSKGAAATQTEQVFSTGGASRFESRLAAAIGFTFAVLFL